MTTYADDDTGIETSRPVEVYDIVAGAVVYRYTSSPTAFTYAGNVYQAIPISRSDTASVTADDRPELTVEMPVSALFIKQCAFGLPPQGVTLTLRRVQQGSGVGVVLWDGVVTTIMVTGRTAKITVPTLMADPTRTRVPSAHCQHSCNHVLYDARCRVARASYEVDTTASAISGDTVTLISNGGNPDRWFLGGEAVVGPERRTIIAHYGNVITLMSPFVGLHAGDGIAVYAGCDHYVKTCHDKFSNVPNFGGHPQLDFRNPFITKLAWK